MTMPTSALHQAGNTAISLEGGSCPLTYYAWIVVVVILIMYCIPHQQNYVCCQHWSPHQHCTVCFNGVWQASSIVRRCWKRAPRKKFINSGSKGGERRLKLGLMKSWKIRFLCVVNWILFSCRKHFVLKPSEFMAGFKALVKALRSKLWLVVA